ncbi:hypothetical protein ACQJBY_024443 [Aegilops geniculata]
MARIQRHRLRSRALCRRSREERRRLSEGGGSAPQPPPPMEQFVPKFEMEKLSEKEIEMAYQNVFHFEEEYKDIMMEHEYYQCEIEKLQTTKSFVDNRLSKLKMTTKAPDSDKLKHIRSATRKSMELQEWIDMANMQISKIRLAKTELEVLYRSSRSIINQHVASEDEEEGLFLGYLAYVMME